MNQLTTRYISGEFEQVWQEIENMDTRQLDQEQSNDVLAVLREMFSRVSYNLGVIYKSLIDIGYRFASEQPLAPPDRNTGLLLGSIQHAVRHFGHIPESVKYFYEIVGSCDFTWNTNDSFPWWEYADPLQIIPIQHVFEYVSENDWYDYMKEQEDEEDGFIPYLELSADYYHKDNVSGGPAYAIALQQQPCFDARFLFEERDTSFVNYLRISIGNCGFSRMDEGSRPESFDNFYKTVKPQLKPF